MQAPLEGAIGIFNVFIKPDFAGERTVIRGPGIVLIPNYLGFRERAPGVELRIMTGSMSLSTLKTKRLMPLFGSGRAIGRNWSVAYSAVSSSVLSAHRLTATPEAVGADLGAVET